MDFWLDRLKARRRGQRHAIEKWNRLKNSSRSAALFSLGLKLGILL
jgi:hypothetical protein